MSAQFGRYCWEGQPLNPDYIEKITTALAPFGPDSNEVYSKDGLDIVYRAFHTTEGSRREVQPHISCSGATITWDGRLDNRGDIIDELRSSLPVNSTDLAIVTAAYESWGTACFAKFIGDWALSVWNPNSRSLILAKDPIGVRQLYYAIGKNEITWSTILDTLVLFAGKTFSVCEEYIAGWLSRHHPAAHLTPYDGIHSVPPASFVLLRPGRHIANKYWDFNPTNKIRYGNDADYEENFRLVFARAVRRRLRSDRPILAHLSGGMDSSSIVCMADSLIDGGSTETPRLDTISWYDDSNPGLDERPYFIKVEQKRGRAGFHIDLRTLAQSEDRAGHSRGEFWSALENRDFVPIPPHFVNADSEFFKLYAACIASGGYRVILSGIAGDDVMGGGVPTPRPELQNLFARARLFKVVYQARVWAVKMRKSPLSLLREALWEFFTPSSVGLGFSPDSDPAPWFQPDFVRRNRAALRGYPSRVKLLGPLPSFQNQIATLNVLRRIVGFLICRRDILCETRYPYLDRCLLEYMYAIPREQIVRLGQRRSLMKRALVGIVPTEVLTRRQKAVVMPKASAATYPDSGKLGEYIISGSIGIVDSNGFIEALQKARQEEEPYLATLMRTCALETWLRHLQIRGILTPSLVAKSGVGNSAREANEVQARARSKGSAS